MSIASLIAVLPLRRGSMRQVSVIQTAPSNAKPALTGA
jgi:hypothetical protein